MDTPMPTMNQPSVEQSALKKQGKILLVLGLLLVGLAVGVYYYFIHQSAEEVPPSLEASNGYQGLISGGDYGFNKWEETDRQAHKKYREDNPNAVEVEVMANVNYMHALTDMTAKDIFTRLNLEDNQAMIAKYVAGAGDVSEFKSQGEAGGYWLTTENTYYGGNIKVVKPEELKIKAGEGFALVIEKGAKAYDVGSYKVFAKEGNGTLKTAQRGWNLVAGHNTTADKYIGEENLKRVKLVYAFDSSKLASDQGKPFVKVYSRDTGLNKLGATDLKNGTLLWVLVDDAGQAPVVAEEQPVVEAEPVVEELPVGDMITCKGKKADEVLAVLINSVGKKELDVAYDHLPTQYKGELQRLVNLAKNIVDKLDTKDVSPLVTKNLEILTKLAEDKYTEILHYVPKDDFSAEALVYLNGEFKDHLVYMMNYLVSVSKWSESILASDKIVIADFLGNDFKEFLKATEEFVKNLPDTPLVPQNFDVEKIVKTYDAYLNVLTGITTEIKSEVDAATVVVAVKFPELDQEAIALLGEPEDDIEVTMVYVDDCWTPDFVRDFFTNNVPVAFDDLQKMSLDVSALLTPETKTLIKDALVTAHTDLTALHASDDLCKSAANILDHTVNYVAKMKGKTITVNQMSIDVPKDAPFELPALESVAGDTFSLITELYPLYGTAVDKTYTPEDGFIGGDIVLAAGKDIDGNEVGGVYCLNVK